MGEGAVCVFLLLNCLSELCRDSKQGFLLFVFGKSGSSPNGSGLTEADCGHMLSGLSKSAIALDVPAVANLTGISC